MGLLNGAVYVTVLSRLWSRSVAYGTCRRPGGSVRAWYEVLSAGPVIGFACADSPALRTHGAAPRLLLLWGCAAHAEGARNAARADHADPNGGLPWPRAPKGTRARRGQRCCDTSNVVASRRLALQRLVRARRPTRLVCSVGGDGAERRGLLVVFAARVHAPQRGLHADVDAPASCTRARTLLRLQQTPADVTCTVHIGCVFISVARCISAACWIVG